ncbi:MAG: acetyl-CoA carboxylase biotin carboxylase subunit [Lentisphaeria bacterium]|nr:acetyl-CoA carboxylase biotin carboxylase subunit [Lentisphaeria bacterium]
MFQRILIANRGEIALRIVRACRELGVESVVVHSEPDRDSLPVQLADRAVCIGPAAATESYLLVDRVFAAAEICGADAIHPGYGFLAENADFAEACEACNICFIGPSAEAIRGMGNKASARATMIEAGVPVVPGSEGLLTDEDHAMATAKAMGFPVIIKASAGGGGRGMRVVEEEGTLVQNYHAARNEALNSFANGDVYMERFIQRPRHIEFQILADKHGNIVHLGERDCSLQRRHQKLIEETPSIVIDDVLRKRMGEAAVAAARAVDYATAGTVEFLLSAEGEFFFMEMNTRIQVEHPVTEVVTGIDLVQEQIRCAAGEHLALEQEDIRFDGHAIEIRINAECPERGFAPCPGPITLCCFPGGPGVRIDSHVYSGCVIPPYYDSLIGKVIVHAPTRDEALARARRALDELHIEGIETTTEFAAKLLGTEAVRKGQTYTKFIEDAMAAGDL